MRRGGIEVLMELKVKSVKRDGFILSVVDGFMHSLSRGIFSHVINGRAAAQK
jgi:hypothetical protein